MEQIPYSDNGLDLPEEKDPHHFFNDEKTEDVSIDENLEETVGSFFERHKTFAVIFGILVISAIITYLLFQSMLGNQSPNRAADQTAQQTVWNVSQGQTSTLKKQPRNSAASHDNANESLSDQMIDIRQSVALLSQTVNDLNHKMDHISKTLNVHQNIVEEKELDEKLSDLNQLIDVQRSNLSEKIQRLASQISNNQQRVNEATANYQKAVQQFNEEKTQLKQKILKPLKGWTLLGATLDSAIVKTKMGKILTVHIGEKIWSVGKVTDISARKVIIGQYYID